MSTCAECKWADWTIELEEDRRQGKCQPVPHLRPAGIVSDRPVCAFFEAHYEHEEEAEAEPEEDSEEAWAKVGERRTMRP